MPVSQEVQIVQDLPRHVAVATTAYGPGERTDWHSHPRAHLLYGVSGVMTVNTEEGRWLVPPKCAVWVPERVEHRVETKNGVRLRSVFVATDGAANMPAKCSVVAIPPLLHELIFAAVALPKLYDSDGPDGRLMSFILDRMQHLTPTSLYLPIPAAPRLRRIVDVLTEDPGDKRGLEDWARTACISSRSLARYFAKETGFTFGAWRQQARLLKALEWLGEKRSVTTIAYDLGYESPASFIAMFRRSMGVSPARYFKRAERLVVSEYS
jgi:AraC-like DNA-binding protein/quercetin dioxygenase-like cupin family protein